MEPPNCTVHVTPGGCERELPIRSAAVLEALTSQRRGILTRSPAGIKQISKGSWKRPVVPAPVNTHPKENGHE